MRCSAILLSAWKTHAMQCLRLLLFYPSSNDRLIRWRMFSPGMCDPCRRRKSTHDLDQPRLLRRMLAPPSEVPSVQPQRPILDIPTASPDLMDPFRRVELGHCGLTAELELSLLAAEPPSVPRIGTMRRDPLVCSTSAGRGALVARVSSDTHPEDEVLAIRGVIPKSGWQAVAGFFSYNQSSAQVTEQSPRDRPIPLSITLT